MRDESQQRRLEADFAAHKDPVAPAAGSPNLVERSPSITNEPTISSVPSKTFQMICETERPSEPSRPTACLQINRRQPEHAKQPHQQPFVEKLHVDAQRPRSHRFAIRPDRLGTDIDRVFAWPGDATGPKLVDEAVDVH